MVMHKCDIVLEREALAAMAAQLQASRDILRSMNHAMLEQHINTCERAMENLAGRIRQRRDKLGNMLNPVFEKWSNDELA